MPGIQVGPILLFVNKDPQPDEADIPGRGTVAGHSWPATAHDQHGRAASLRFFMCDTGDRGIVDCRLNGTDTAFTRLERGARLGVYASGDGQYTVKQLRVLRFVPANGWGNATLTNRAELDSLAGGSLDRLLRQLQVTRLGTKQAVLREKGNDMAAAWMSESGPAAPLGLYVLTRVVPIVKALDAIPSAVAS